jgi:hypothetical protein
LRCLSDHPIQDFIQEDLLDILPFDIDRLAHVHLVQALGGCDGEGLGQVSRAIAS